MRKISQFLLGVFILLTCVLGWAEEYLQDKNGKWYSLRPQEKILFSKLDKIENTLDKIYSMVVDLEIKFMGIERYNQIYDRNNEGEVAKQRKYDEYIQKVIKGQILQDE